MNHGSIEVVSGEIDRLQIQARVWFERPATRAQNETVAFEDLINVVRRGTELVLVDPHEGTVATR